MGRRPAGKLEPTVLLTAIAGATERIGLIATASTTYNEPFNLARRFASVDWVSGGRAGWNVVTTAGPDAARNFGVDDQPAHAVRYERAAEFIEVAQKPWDSWQDDAVLADKAEGVWADAGKIRVIGSTQEEALELEQELDRLIKPEYARIQLAKTLRVSPEDLPLDRQLPDNLPSEDEIEGAKGRYTLIVQLARRENLTVRQLIVHRIGVLMGRREQCAGGAAA